MTEQTDDPSDAAPGTFDEHVREGGAEMAVSDPQAFAGLAQMAQMIQAQIDMLQQQIEMLAAQIDEL